MLFFLEQVPCVAFRLNSSEEVRSFHHVHNPHQHGHYDDGAQQPIGKLHKRAEYLFIIPKWVLSNFLDMKLKVFLSSLSI